jgi:hypothetical protein
VRSVFLIFLVFVSNVADVCGLSIFDCCFGFLYVYLSKMFWHVIRYSFPSRGPVLLILFLCCVLSCVFNVSVSLNCQFFITPSVFSSQNKLNLILWKKLFSSCIYIFTSWVCFLAFIVQYYSTRGPHYIGRRENRRGSVSHLFSLCVQCCRCLWTVHF